MVSVEVVELPDGGVTGWGTKFAVAPAGRPDVTDKFTALLNPA
jgi:hypothetical protein